MTPFALFIFLWLAVAFGLIIGFILISRRDFEADALQREMGYERFSDTIHFDDLPETEAPTMPKEESTQAIDTSALEAELEDIENAQLEGALFEAIERYLEENPNMARWHRNVANRLSWEWELNRPLETWE